MKLQQYLLFLLYISSVLLKTFFFKFPTNSCSEFIETAQHTRFCDFIMLGLSNKSVEYPKMQSIPEDKILRFHPDTLEAVRKEFNLDQPGRMSDAVDLFQDWVNKQDHFVKRDFSKEYLERTIISTKGLVERAKQRLDKLCTFKTLMPNFFQDTDVETLYKNLQNFVTCAHLPVMTKDYYRVFMMKMNSDNLDSSILFQYYKYTAILSEYLKSHDYCSGFIIVLDLTDVNVMSMTTKLNPLDLRQTMTLLTEGYGMRIKGIHLISPSRMVDGFISILKQVLSAKIGGRIHVHKSTETLYEFVPKDILPVNFGGKERSLKELNDEWIEVLSSREYAEYLKEMNRATTDESYRQTDKFNEQYMGTPGSFRTLSVD